MSINTVNNKFLGLPDDVAFQVVSFLNLKDMAKVNQVSRAWRAIGTDFRTVKPLLQRELRVLYQEDPLSKNTEKFFVENVKAFNAKEENYLEKLIDLYSRDNADSLEGEKKCAEKRLFLWKWFLKKYPQFELIKEELSLLKQGVNEKLKQEDSKHTFDTLFSYLKEMAKTEEQDVGRAWQEKHLLMCAVFLELGFLDEGFIGNTITLLERQYVEKENKSVVCPIPLNKNTAFLIRVLSEKGILFTRLNYPNDDDNGRSYLHQLLASLDPEKEFGLEKQKLAEKNCAELREVIEETGLLLLKNGSTICHTDMKLAGRFGCYELAFAILKKRIELGKSFEQTFSILDKREMEDPQLAFYLLNRLREEKLSLTDVGSSETSSLLSDVIYFLTVPSYRNKKFSDEDWSGLWIKVAKELIALGEDPTRMVIASVREVADRGIVFSGEKTTPSKLAKEQNLTKLVELFNSNR